MYSSSYGLDYFLSSYSLSSILFFVILIALVGGLIWAIRTRNNEPVILSKLFGIKFYFQAVRLISLVVITFAVALIFKAGLAGIINADFSYSKAELCDGIRYIPTNDSKYTSTTDVDKYCAYEAITSGYTGTTSSYSGTSYDTTFYNSQASFLNDKGTVLIKRDLLQGISFLSIGFPLFIVHTLLYRKYFESFNIIDKVFLISISLVYGLLSVFSVTLALYGVLSNLFISAEGNTTPGLYIAVAVSTLPIWVYFLYRTLKTSKNSDLQQNFV